MNKRIWITVLPVVFLASLAIAAQMPQQKPQDVAAKIKKWQAALNLTEKQAADIRQVLERTGGPGGEQGPPPGGDEMGPPPGGGGGMPPMGMGGRSDREVEALLTKDQAVKFRALRKTERVDEQLAQLTEQLKLTPDQAVKIKAVLAAADDREAGFRDSSPEDGPPDFEALMALQEKRNAEIMAVLTPAQKKIFEASQPERR
ncbi:MAG: hypothetical protein PHI34_07570 [Acidobacteriota bacterium]|nr:hypothetical protein [Acidobacteriota bacterium]